jgi:hypothetical protein
MDTITSALKTQRELDAYTCFGSSGLKVRIPLGQIGRKLTLDSAWPVLERTVPVIDRSPGINPKKLAAVVAKTASGRHLFYGVNYWTEIDL